MTFSSNFHEFCLQNNIHSLEDLRKNFQVATILESYRNGSLIDWLKENHHQEYAIALEEMKKDSSFTNYEVISHIARILRIPILPIELQEGLPTRATNSDASQIKKRVAEGNPENLDIPLTFHLDPANQKQLAQANNLTSSQDTLASLKTDSANTTNDTTTNQQLVAKIEPRRIVSGVGGSVSGVFAGQYGALHNKINTAPARSYTGDGDQSNKLDPVNAGASATSRDIKHVHRSCYGKDNNLSTLEILAKKMNISSLFKNRNYQQSEQDAQAEVLAEAQAGIIIHQSSINNLNTPTQDEDITSPHIDYDLPSTCESNEKSIEPTKSVLSSAKVSTELNSKEPLAPNTENTENSENSENSVSTLAPSVDLPLADINAVVSLTEARVALINELYTDYTGLIEQNTERLRNTYQQNIAKEQAIQAQQAKQAQAEETQENQTEQIKQVEYNTHHALNKQRALNEYSEQSEQSEHSEQSEQTEMDIYLDSLKEKVTIEVDRGPWQREKLELDRVVVKAVINDYFDNYYNLVRTIIDYSNDNVIIENCLAEIIKNYRGLFESEYRSLMYTCIYSAPRAVFIMMKFAVMRRKYLNLVSESNLHSELSKLAGFDVHEEVPSVKRSRRIRRLIENFHSLRNSLAYLFALKQNAKKVKRSDVPKIKLTQRQAIIESIKNPQNKHELFTLGSTELRHVCDNISGVIMNEERLLQTTLDAFLRNYDKIKAVFGYDFKRINCADACIVGTWMELESFDRPICVLYCGKDLQVRSSNTSRNVFTGEMLNGKLLIFNGIEFKIAKDKSLSTATSKKDARRKVEATRISGVMFSNQSNIVQNDFSLVYVRL